MGRDETRAPLKTPAWEVYRLKLTCDQAFPFSFVSQTKREEGHLITGYYFKLKGTSSVYEKVEFLSCFVVYSSFSKTAPLQRLLSVKGMQNSKLGL